MKVIVVFKFFPIHFARLLPGVNPAAFPIESCFHVKSSAVPQQYGRLPENVPVMHRGGAAPQRGDAWPRCRFAPAASRLPLCVQGARNTVVKLEVLRRFGKPEPTAKPA